MTTVTAGDYSVSFEIEEKNYIAWKETVYRAPGGGFERGEAPAFALKKHMCEVIESRLPEWVNSDAAILARQEIYGNKAAGKVFEGCKVADIVFSFNNADLINALKIRGACIASQDFDAMREQEDKINDLFANFDKLTIPSDAFITFESDDSAEFAKMVGRDGDNFEYLKMLN